MNYRKEIYKLCDEMTTLAFEISKPTPNVIESNERFKEEVNRIETSFRSIYKIMCDDEDMTEFLRYETERLARNLCAMNFVIFSRIRENTPVEAMQRARLHAIYWLGYLIKRIKLALDGKKID